MAKYLKGILGPFTGLVGTVVGATWRGIQIMRSRPVKPGGIPTEAQERQRAAFTLTMQFLRPITDVLTIGFQAYRDGLTPFNAAFAENIQEAVTGVYPALTINYPQITIARGKLLSPPGMSVGSTVAGELLFAWTNNADPDSSNGTDRASFVVYNPAKQAFARALHVAVRSDSSYAMVLPPDWPDDSVYAWCFFTNASGKLSSNSSYIGTATVL